MNLGETWIRPSGLCSPWFIDRDKPIILQIVVLGVTTIALEFAVLSAYGAGAARIAMARGFATVTSRLSGVLLVGAALGLLRLKR